MSLVPDNHDTTPPAVRKMVSNTLDRLLAEAGVTTRGPRRHTPAPSIQTRIDWILRKAEVETGKYADQLPSEKQDRGA